MPVLIPCPSCKARLKVPDNLIGLNKVIKCPGCAQPINLAKMRPAPIPAAPTPAASTKSKPAASVAKKPAVEEEAFDGFEEVDDGEAPPKSRKAGRDSEDDKIEADRLPAKKKASRDQEDRPARPRKGKKKGKSGGKGLVIGLSVGLAILALVGGGVGLYFAFRGEPSGQGGTGGGGGSGSLAGADSPQAVFAASIAALRKSDDRGMIVCFTLETQKVIATDLAFGALNQQSAAQGPQGEQTRQQFKPVLDVLDKYGLTYPVTKHLNLNMTDQGGMDRTKQELQEMIKDPVGLYADLQEAYRKALKEERKVDPSLPDPKLTELQIIGDKATASVVFKQGGKEAKQPIEFVKIGGSWKIATRP